MRCERVRCCLGGAVVVGADATSAAAEDGRWNNVDNAKKVDLFRSDESNFSLYDDTLLLLGLRSNKAWLMVKVKTSFRR